MYACMYSGLADAGEYPGNAACWALSQTWRYWDRLTGSPKSARLKKPPEGELVDNVALLD
jgi:hypothetical protein